MFICKFCQKGCKHSNSLVQHEIRCLRNENRIKMAGKDNPMFGKSGLNQHSKAKQLGKLYTITDINRENLSKAMSGKKLSEETKNKISNNIIEKVKEGKWHVSLAKKIYKKYKGINFHGSWELFYAKYLDKKKIKWERCKTHFSYFFENKHRIYTPDFHLLETDEYVEIKGYKTEKDVAKWAQFPKDKKLIILMENEMKQLGMKT